MELAETEPHRARICANNRQQLSVCVAKCFQRRPTLVAWRVGVELSVGYSGDMVNWA